MGYRLIKTALLCNTLVEISVSIKRTAITLQVKSDLFVIILKMKAGYNYLQTLILLMIFAIKCLNGDQNKLADTACNMKQLKLVAHVSGIKDK